MGIPTTTSTLNGQDERLHRVALAAARTGVFEYQAYPATLHLDARSADILGFDSAKTLSGTELAGHISNGGADALAELARAAERGDSVDTRIHMRDAAGEERVLHLRAAAIGRNRIAGTFTAATPRMDRLAQLENENSFLAQVLDSVPVQIFVKEADELRFVRLNREGERMTGLTRREAIGKTDYDFFPAEEADFFTTMDRAVLASEEVVDIPEERLHTAHRGTRILHTRKVAITLPDGSRFLVGTSQDITAQKAAETAVSEYASKLEIAREEAEAKAAELIETMSELERANEALRQNREHLVDSEKMASLGLLAAGVAHEINNPVGYVTSNLRTLKSYFEKLVATIARYEEILRGTGCQVTEQKIRAIRESEDLNFAIQDAAELVDDSRAGLSQVAEIVASLKGFARQDPGVHMLTNVNSCVEQTLRVAWNEMKHRCHVTKDLGDLPRIQCNPGKLNQVIMNLLINASQAVDEDGEVSVQTGVNGDHVTITVSDNGCGIPPEDTERIFTPFYTTKPVGEGTGLGLSIAYGIVRHYGGRIDVTSDLGHGSAFTVSLPIRREDRKEPAAQRPFYAPILGPQIRKPARLRSR